MSFTRKLEVLFAALLILACVVLGASNYYLQTRKASTERSYHQASGNAYAADAEAQELRIIYTEKEKAYEELGKALERNPEWSTEPVPADVADLLRHDSGATRAVP